MRWFCFTVPELNSNYEGAFMYIMNAVLSQSIKWIYSITIRKSGSLKISHVLSKPNQQFGKPFPSCDVRAHANRREYDNGATG